VERLRAFRPTSSISRWRPIFWATARCGLPEMEDSGRRLVPYPLRDLSQTLLVRGRLGGLLRYYLRRSYGACREVYVPSQSMVEALLTDGSETISSSAPRRGHDALQSRQEIEPLACEAWNRRKRARRRFRLPPCARKAARHAGRRAAAAGGGRIAHRSVIVGDGPERAALQRNCPTPSSPASWRGRTRRGLCVVRHLVFPSETETFGSVTLERWLRDCPVSAPMQRAAVRW